LKKHIFLSHFAFPWPHDEHRVARHLIVPPNGFLPSWTPDVIELPARAPIPEG